VTVLDLHLLPPASATLIIALMGAAALAVGLGLRSLLNRPSPRHPDGSAAEDSPASCVASSDVRGRQPAALVAIDRFADVLDRSRRLVAAEERVARELTRADGWVVERYVLVGLHRVPFVLIGPSGIFALCATDGAWTLYDLEVLSSLGDELRDRLPGYRGRVEAVVCLAYDRANPRAWYGGPDRGGRGGWVVGINQLLPWLHGWGAELGLAPGDVSRIAVEAGPHWQRRSTPRLPASGNAG
jgi:hypothetical protein